MSNSAKSLPNFWYTGSDYFDSLPLMLIKMRMQQEQGNAFSRIYDAYMHMLVPFKFQDVDANKKKNASYRAPSPFLIMT